MAKIDKETPVKFIETTTGKLNTVLSDPENAGAFIHVNDDNGDDTFDNQLYIGKDRVTDNFNIGSENLDTQFLKVGGLGAYPELSTFGDLKDLRLSQIVERILTPISVTSITLNKQTHSFEVNNTVTLTATVSPSNAEDKTVTWSSSDTSVATVNSSGKITAKKVGQATITARAGGKSATCVVIVNPTAPTVSTQPSASISYSGSKLIKVGTNLPDGVSSNIIPGEWSDYTPCTDINGNTITLSMTKDGSPVEFGSTSTEGIYTISGSVVFVEGGNPKDNDNPPTEYAAYQVNNINPYNTNTITITAVEPILINDGVDIDDMVEHIINYFGTINPLIVTIPPETVDKKFTIKTNAVFSKIEVHQYNKFSEAVLDEDKYDIDIDLVYDSENNEYVRYVKYPSERKGESKYKINFIR